MERRTGGLGTLASITAVLALSSLSPQLAHAGTVAWSAANGPNSAGVNAGAGNVGPYFVAGGPVDPRNGGPGIQDFVNTQVVESGDLSGPNPQFAIDSGLSPNFGDGRPVVLMGAGKDVQGAARFNEYDKSTFSATEIAYRATFRVVNTDNSVGIGDAQLMLRLKNGPGIAITVGDKDYNNVQGNGTIQDHYWFQIAKYHDDSEVVKLANIESLPLSPGSTTTTGTTLKESDYHTAWLYVNSITDQVRVNWDGQEIFNQVIAPWTSRSGSAFFDPWDGAAMFGDKGLIVHDGNSKFSQSAFSDILVTSDIFGTPFGANGVQFVPEPNTMVLALLGFAGCAWWRRRKHLAA